MAVSGEPDDAGIEVVVDLAAHFVLDVVFGFVGVGNPEAVGGDTAFGEKPVVVAEDSVETIAFAGDVVPEHLGNALEGGGKGKVGGAPDLAAGIGGGDADEGKGDVLLLAETDGGDRFFFGIPENPEKLFHAAPFPSAVGSVLEAGVIHGLDRLGGVGEKRIGRGDAEAEPVVEWEAETSDAGEELDPGEKKPGRRAGQTGPETVGEEVNGEEAGGQKGEGPGFSDGEMPTRAHGNPQCHKAEDEKEFAHRVPRWGTGESGAGARDAVSREYGVG